MTYEEAKAEFLSISGIRLQKWQEDFIDRLHKNPKIIIKIKRGTGVDRYDNLIYLLRAIEDFRINEVKQKMTYEQAHEILEDLLRAMTYNRLLFSGDMLKAIGVAVESVELQIPKKPTEYDSVPHGRCPNCHSAVKMYCDDPKNKYCIWCGQALAWSDEDTKKDGKRFDRMYFDEFKQKD